MSENVTPVEADPKITHIFWHIPPHPITHTHTLWINPPNCDAYPSQGICRGRWTIGDKEKFIREEKEEEEIKINNVYRTTVQDKIFWVLVTKTWRAWKDRNLSNQSFSLTCGKHCSRTSLLSHNQSWYTRTWRKVLGIPSLNSGVGSPIASNIKKQTLT